MKSSNLRIAVCPLCQNHMNNLEAEKGLYVDFCKPCGVTWLDQGELGQIIGRNADLPSIAKPHSSRVTRAVCSACNQQSLEPWMVETIGFYKCNLCQGILIALKDARKFRQFFQHHSQNKFLEGKKDRNAYEDLGSFQTPHFDLVAIPCVLFIGYWMEYFRLTRYLAWYFSMIFHELGHGVAAWLGGYFAIPTPFAVTFHSGSRSSFVIVAVLAVCCRGFIFAFNARSLASGFFFVTLLSAQVYLSFFADYNIAQQAFIASGIVGEMIFSSLLLGLFYFRLPWRWDFWRFLSLFFGTLLYSQSILRWIKIKIDFAEIPWGSALGGQKDGDLMRLKENFLWTRDNIVDFYYQMALICLSFILASYFWFLLSRKIRHKKNS